PSRSFWGVIVLDGPMIGPSRSLEGGEKEGEEGEGWDGRSNRRKYLENREKWGKGSLFDAKMLSLQPLLQL
ncbi:MAG: hypothetical protein J6P69_02680, partial [Bacteroidales bacterium]|nr:hypothetical protein [Bacteroidales bacterium]